MSSISLAESDVVVSGSDSGESPKGEGALDLAHVVLQDVRRAKALEEKGNVTFNGKHRGPSCIAAILL